MDQKISINSLDAALIVCRRCQKEKTFQLSELIKDKPKMRFQYKCVCGHIQRAVIVKKYSPAQDVHFAGTFLAKATSPRARSRSGQMVVTRINSNGAVLITRIEETLNPGQDLMLEFVLDDSKQSIVKKDVRILARNGRYLTTEFLSKEHEDNLGPYLFFNKLFV